MSVFVLWSLILVAVVVPDIAPHAIGIGSHPPDVWVLVVAYLAIRGRGYSAVGWAIVLGLVRDSLSLDPLGTHAFVLGTVAFLFCEGPRHRGRIDGVLALVVTLAAGLLAGWIYVLRVLPLGGPPPWAALWHAIPVAGFTTLLALGLFPFLDRHRLLDDLVGRTRGLPA